LRHPRVVRRLRQRGDGDGAEGNLAHFGGQRQLEPALGERAHQRTYAYAGLRPDRGLAEFQDLVERTHVDRRAAVAADAARLRIIGAHHSNRGRITLGFGQNARQVFEALELEDQPRPAINAR